MTTADPAKAIAREIASLRREVTSISRGSQLAHSSLVVDGETTTVPQTVRTATKALQAANGKNAVTYSASSPSGEGTAPGDIWFQLADGVVTGNWEWTGTAWEPRTYGDEVLSSLTVGKLVAGEIAAGQRIIAGPADGTHAEMADTGFRVFKEDPVDGVPNEVIRMGTTDAQGNPTNDYIGVVDGTGNIIGAIDETGRGNFSGLNVVGEVRINGELLSDVVGSTSTGIVGRWTGQIDGLNGEVGLGIRSEYGIAQFTFPCDSGRSYLIQLNGPIWYFHQAGEEYAGGGANGGEARLILRYENNAAVTINSPIITDWMYTGVPSGAWQRPSLTYVWHADFTGTCNLGVAMRMDWPPNDQAAIRIPAGTVVVMEAFDMGPSGVATAGNQTGMGGGLYQGPPAPPPPPPTTQHYVDLGPVGKASWRGDGSLRTDLGSMEVVQGWDPSGYNGDGRGTYWFDLPPITGTVDRVDVYLYSSHWYYNAGGRVVLNISDHRGDTPLMWKFRDDWVIFGYPKPGGKTVTLPGDWNAYFRGTTNDIANGRATAITIGPSNNQMLEYYGRITDCRLRIWYTQ